MPRLSFAIELVPLLEFVEGGCAWWIEYNVALYKAAQHAFLSILCGIWVDD